MSSDISFYWRLILRKAHWVLLVFAIFAAASITLARILPPVFVTTARLMVEPPQIPENLAASTVRTSPAEELQIMEQRLMTRVNLIDIARSEGVFDNIGEMTPDEIVKEMRDATRIASAAGQGQATLMNIEFSNKKARVVADVVNRYVTIVMQDAIDIRTKSANETLAFFESEVSRLDGILKEQSAAILAFNNKNADALPTTLPFRLQQQSQVQTRIATINQNVANLKRQRARLVEVFQSTGAVSSSGTNATSPEQAQLAQLQNQLRNALTLYSPEHPRVKQLQSQVALQAELIREQAGVEDEPAAAETQNASILQVQLADIDARIEVFEEELLTSKAQLDAVTETIERTPDVQIGLDALNREFSLTQTQYNNAVRGLSDARVGVTIETKSKGRRITLIDPATVPNFPASPNRLLIILGGSLFGLILGVGLVLLMELLNTSIRRPVEISRQLGITPLSTIPYVRTPMELVARRAIFTAVFLAVVVGVPALLYAIHTYYLPLDLIYERISDRFTKVL